MKLKITLSALVLGTTMSAYGSATEDVNYGDPTASYRGLGVQANDKEAQVSGVFGSGQHIASFDLGTDFNGGYNYRARYFNVNQASGFGWSVDTIGSNDSDGILGGLVQKYQVSDNIILVPMLAAGRVFAKPGQGTSGTNVVQPGLYALYAFHAGHWLYANPKATYVTEAEEWTQEVEAGGGYLLNDVSSLGFKVDYKRFQGKDNTTAWANLYYYF